MELPTTIAGRLGVLLAATTILLAWGAVVIRLARAHIDRRIDTRLEDVVSNCVVKAVDAAVEPMRVQIHNGLTKRTERIEDKLDLLLMNLAPDWDGSERRRHTI